VAVLAGPVRAPDSAAEALAVALRGFDPGHVVVVLIREAADYTAWRWALAEGAPRLRDAHVIRQTFCRPADSRKPWRPAPDAQPATICRGVVVECAAGWIVVGDTDGEADETLVESALALVAELEAAR
jgi:hypothetical protein